MTRSFIAPYLLMWLAQQKYSICHIGSLPLYAQSRNAARSRQMLNLPTWLLSFIIITFTRLSTCLPVRLYSLTERHELREVRTRPANERVIRTDQRDDDIIMTTTGK